MEDTDVRLATFGGWQKLGRVVRKGAHSEMRSASGQHLFTKDQTRPIRSNPVEEAVEEVVKDLFEVGKIYRTRDYSSYNSSRMVIERSEKGKLRVAGWHEREKTWTPTGWRDADGKMRSDGHENGLDLMPGEIEDLAEEKPPVNPVYDDPSAQRDAEHAPASPYTPREAPMRGLPGWTMTKSNSDPIGFESREPRGLERIAATPNSWGK